MFIHSTTHSQVHGCCAIYRIRILQNMLQSVYLVLGYLHSLQVLYSYSHFAFLFNVNQSLVASIDFLYEMENDTCLSTHSNT